MTDKEKIGYCIKEARKNIGMTQEELAFKVGFASRSSISKIEKGERDLTRKKLMEIAKVLNVKPGSLMGMYDYVTPVMECSSHKYSYLDSPISAGTPETFDDVYELPSISIADCFLGRYAGNKDVVIMRVNGESMNRIIPDKSVIAVKRNVDINSIHDGDIVVVYINGSNCGYTVKHFYRDTKKDIIILRPDSTCTSFTDITVNKENDDSLYLIGKVIAYNVIL